MSIQWRAKGQIPPPLQPGERSGATPDERHSLKYALEAAIERSRLKSADGTAGVLQHILREEIRTRLPKQQRRYSISRPDRLIHIAVELGVIRWVAPHDAVEHFGLHISRRDAILRVADLSMLEERTAEGPWTKPILAALVSR